MAKQAVAIPVDTKIEDYSLVTEMQKSFAEYAMAVLVGRAIPDARDGLKPIHRRIIFAMHELGLEFDKPFKKSARIEGEVMGKYSPHGGSYGAMVTIAAGYLRPLPLIDGHGNWGTLSDGPAAARYTEARLSKYAQFAMLGDLTKQSVSWRPNYDGSEVEPEALPAMLPNLLFSDTEGIAVGFACSHVPYNVGEVISLCQAHVKSRIKGKRLSPEEILQHIKGPDFVSKGVIIEGAGIAEAILTGHGSIRIEGKWQTEDIILYGAGKRGKDISGVAVVIHELPFRVDSEHLMNEIAELAKEGKMPNLIGLQNESARGEIRLVLMFKDGSVPESEMAVVYKQTSFKKTISANALAISNNKPIRLGVDDIVNLWLEFRISTINALLNEQLELLLSKQHISEGFAKILDRIDKAIAIIRGSQTTKEAKQGLIAEFKLSEAQASSVLEMQLRRLVKLEADELNRLLAQLAKEAKDIEITLSCETNVLKLIQSQLKSLDKDFSQPRNTPVVPPTVMPLIAAAKEDDNPIPGWMYYWDQKVLTSGRAWDCEPGTWKVYHKDTKAMWAAVILSNGMAYRVPASALTDKPQSIKVVLAKHCKGVDAKAKVVFVQPWKQDVLRHKVYAVLTTKKFKIAPEWHFFFLNRSGSQVINLEPDEQIIQILGFVSSDKVQVLKDAKPKQLSMSISNGKGARGVNSQGCNWLETTETDSTYYFTKL